MTREIESRKSLNQVNHGSDNGLPDNLKGSLPSIEKIEREMSEWKEYVLKNLVNIRVSNVDKKIHNGKSLVKLCNYMDVYSNDYIKNDIPFQIGSADINELSRFSLKCDDVIITKDSESPDDIAVPAVISEVIEQLVCGYHLAILRPDPAQIYGIFLMHKLKLPEVKNHFFQVANGSTRYGLTIGDIENVKINIPTSLPEQRKIARILSTVDAVIEKSEAAIAKYKAIKSGMMRDLFTRGIDLNTGKLRPRYEDAPELYKQSELGWVSKEWEVIQIKDIAVHLGSGVTPTGGSNIYKTEGILFLRSQNIHFNGLHLNDVAYIVQEIHDSMDRSKVYPFDVLLNITGASIGRCCYFPPELEEANVNQHVCIIRVYNPSYEKSLYISTFLSSFFGQNQIDRLNAGGNREGLNYQQLRKFYIPWPKNNNEIDKCANVLKSINKKIAAEVDCCDKLRLEKQALMSDLLTGKVRVKYNEEIAEAQ